MTSLRLTVIIISYRLCQCNAVKLLKLFKSEPVTWLDPFLGLQSAQPLKFSDGNFMFWKYMLAGHRD